MAGRPQVITRKSNGAPANPSTDIVSRCAVIAPSYTGTLHTKQYTRRKQVYDQYTEGPLVRAAVHCIEETTIPIVTQRCDASNAGTYDTIDVSGFTGTAVPVVKSGTVPRNEYELYFVCIEGGTIGSADPPIKYRLSTAAGRGIDSKDLLRLGTATSVTFGNSGCAFEFDPPAAQVTALIALAVELQADRLLHYADGTAHNSADAAAAALITLAAPTTGVEAIAVLNEVRLADVAHYANDTAHDSPDFINEVTVAAATTLQSARLLAIHLKAKANLHNAVTHAADPVALKAATATTVGVQSYSATSGLLAGGITTLNAAPGKLIFTTAGGTPADAPATVTISGTNALTDAADTEVVNVAQTATTVTSTKYWKGTSLSVTYSAGDGTGATVSIGIAARVHNSADVSNDITAADPTPGIMNAGDVVECQTFAPYPSANELAAAFVTISEGDKFPGLVLLPWRVTPSYGPTITEGLDLLRDNGLPCQCIVQARAFDVGTDVDLETYRDNLETEWAAVADDRITVVATDLLFTLADGTATISVPEQRLTGGAISFAARVIDTPLGQTTWAPADGPIEGGSLVDNEGALIGWNEPIGNDSTRLQLFYRVPDAIFGRPTVPSVDNCLTDPETGIKTLRGGRIWDQIDRIVRSFAWSTVGLTADVAINPNNASQGVLSEEKRQDLIRRCAARLESDPVLQACITNLSDPNLVTLESDVTVNGEVVYLEFNTNAVASLGIGKITFTHNVRTGGN